MSDAPDRTEARDVKVTLAELDALASLVDELLRATGAQHARPAATGLAALAGMAWQWQAAGDDDQDSEGDGNG